MRHRDSSLSVCPAILLCTGSGCKSRSRQTGPRRPCSNRLGRRTHDQENGEADGVGAVGCGPCHRRRGIAGRCGPCRSWPHRRAGRKLYPRQPLCGSGKSMQPLCSRQPLQSLCGGKEPLQSLRGSEPLRCGESLQALQSLRGQNELTLLSAFALRGQPSGLSGGPAAARALVSSSEGGASLRLTPCPIVATGDITPL